MTNGQYQRVPPTIVHRFMCPLCPGLAGHGRLLRTCNTRFADTNALHAYASRRPININTCKPYSISLVPQQCTHTITSYISPASSSTKYSTHIAFSQMRRSMLSLLLKYTLLAIVRNRMLMTVNDCMRELLWLPFPHRHVLNPGFAYALVSGQRRHCRFARIPKHQNLPGVPSSP